jgi:phage shock protein A
MEVLRVVNSNASDVQALGNRLKNVEDEIQKLKSNYEDLDANIIEIKETHTAASSQITPPTSPSTSDSNKVHFQKSKEILLFFK